MSATHRTAALLAMLLLSLSEAEDTIRLPVEVDQQGTTVPFVTDASSDLPTEAEKFCAAHLRLMPKAECIANLIEQVNAIRKVRTEAAMSLPGLTFTVNDPYGATQRFVHEEFADPAQESLEFCRQHFPDAEERACVEAMLANAQRALEEIRARDN